MVFKRLFSGNEKRLKAAFHAIKIDMDHLELDQKALEAENESLRRQLQDWATYAEEENCRLRSRVADLERQVKSLRAKEMEQTRSMLDLESTSLSAEL